jgi:hypothetical protein
MHGDERSHSRVIQLMTSMRGGLRTDVARSKGVMHGGQRTPRSVLAQTTASCRTSVS